VCYVRLRDEKCEGGPVGLAALALIFMLSEGVANDWSALEARDTLEISAAVAALSPPR
jgi:hypothetical protein